jgi:iron only hydrogenase large subunit-like protein
LTRFHSVRLDTDKCKGCTNCLKHCPTEAIRVRGGRAHIIDERCVDCGECIRICGYHAKVAMTDKLEDIFQFEHRIALPAPTLYGQFRHLSDVGLVLDALLSIGFTGVYEVARGADVATKAIHDRLRQPGRLKPLISSACPTITRIIQVRFPTLIPHIIDVRQPMEIAASLARTEYVRQHGCAPDEVGVFFITPCAAKMTAIRNPIGHERSAINGAIAITDVLNKLLPYVTGVKASQHHTRATPYGIGWASSGGEVDAAIPRNSMAVDGIDNVIRVLEEVEDGKLNDIDYFEGAACPGGCVGGPLTYANNYLAQNTIATLKKAMPEQHPLKSVTGADMNTVPLYFDRSISQNQSLKLDDNINDALDRMAQMDEIMSRLPGYDCGSCGSPTCRTFAEDIVRGYCTEIDCIHILKNRLKVMAQQMVDLAQNSRE